MGRSFFRPAHRDAAEPAIIDALRSVGASVHQLSGKDIPDLLVGYKGQTFLLEVKSRIQELGKGRKTAYTRVTKVSEGQKAFMDGWRGGVVRVVHTPEEALYAIGAPVEGVLQPIPGMRMMSPALQHAIREMRPGSGKDLLLPVHPNSIAGKAIRAEVAAKGHMDIEEGHLVTPAYQKAQTKAVVPKKKPGTRRKSGA